MTTITPRELRHRETWQFRAYGFDVQVGWMADPGDGLADAWAIIDGEKFGPFANEDSAILAALAYAKDRQRVPTGDQANGADAVTAA